MIGDSGCLENLHKKILFVPIKSLSSVEIKRCGTSASTLRVPVLALLSSVTWSVRVVFGKNFREIPKFTKITDLPLFLTALDWLVHVILAAMVVNCVKELGSDSARAGTTAQAQRQQWRAVHQAGPHLTTVHQGVHRGFPRQIWQVPRYRTVPVIGSRCSLITRVANNNFRYGEPFIVRFYIAVLANFGKYLPAMQVNRYRYASRMFF
jgi:hypothetical protein